MAAEIQKLEAAARMAMGTSRAMARQQRSRSPAFLVRSMRFWRWRLLLACSF